MTTGNYSPSPVVLVLTACPGHSDSKAGKGTVVPPHMHKTLRPGYVAIQHTQKAKALITPPPLTKAPFAVKRDFVQKFKGRRDNKIFFALTSHNFIPDAMKTRGQHHFPAFYHGWEDASTAMSKFCATSHGFVSFKKLLNVIDHGLIEEAFEKIDQFYAQLEHVQDPCLAPAPVAGSPQKSVMKQTADDCSPAGSLLSSLSTLGSVSGSARRCHVGSDTASTAVEVKDVQMSERSKQRAGGGRSSPDLCSDPPCG